MTNKEKCFACSNYADYVQIESGMAYCTKCLKNKFDNIEQLTNGTQAEVFKNRRKQMQKILKIFEN